MFLMGVMFGVWAEPKAQIMDDFSVVESNAWTVESTGSMTAVRTGEVFRMTAEAGTTGKSKASLNLRVKGDFATDVAYRVAWFSGGADARAQLIVAGEKSFVTLYYHRFEAKHAEIIFGGTLDGTAAVYTFNEDNVPDTGVLRLMRTRDTLTAQLWDGSTWRNIGTKAGFTEDATVRLQSQTTSTFPGVEFYFDNFRLEADALLSNLAITQQPPGGPAMITSKPITLHVTTSGGFGPVQYEWLQDSGSGTKPVGTGDTWTIAKPDTTSAGTYTCRISDSVMSLMSAPITLKAGNATPPASSPAASSNGDTTVKTQPKSSNHSPPVPTDNGSYWCETSNTLHQVKSNTATLQVGETMTFTQHPQSIKQHSQEDPCTFKAAIQGGTEPVKLKWMFKKDDTVSCVGSGDTYTISAPTDAQTGIYWCEASDARKTIRSNTASLEVAPPPPTTTVP